MLRWFLFIASLALGIAAALYYGWVISPVKYIDTTPDTLRADYKADYVLMVSESYRADADLDLAVHRLAVLGNTPTETVTQALSFAVQHHYETSDLALMQQLADDLRNWKPALETPQP